MESESSESTDLEECRLSELKCAQCNKYTRPPITFCVNGHKICEICKPEFRHCPKCKDEFADQRNLVLEGLTIQVKYPCKFRAYGCKETCSLDTIDDHQAKCQYIQQKCPAAKLASGTCSWLGLYSDMKGHLKENHPELCYEYVEGDFKFIYNINVDVSLFCFIFAYNEIFFSSFLVEKNIFYAVVLYVGPAENAAKYKYRLEFVNKDNTEGVTVMHLTRRSDENLREVYKSGNCVKLHYDVVKHFKKKASLKYKLYIIGEGN